LILIVEMGYSPFLRQVAFWGSFYVFYNYSSKDVETRRNRYPSYVIFKEKLVKGMWDDNFSS